MDKKDHRKGRTAEGFSRKTMILTINSTEEQEQYALAAWLNAIGALYTHVPNGGKRHVVTAMTLKRCGVKPGVPDILIFDAPKNGWQLIGNVHRLRTEPHGVAIELKRRKGGQLSLAQKVWIDSLRENGWIVEVCYGTDAAIEFLKSLGYGVR